MLIKIIILTLALVLFYTSGRILFGSMKKRYQKIKFKYKIRIHHGYIGIVLIGIYFIYKQELLFIVGTALLLSDIIHHFIILPILINKTEFP